MADWTEKNNGEFLGFLRWVELEEMQVIPQLIQNCESTEKQFKPTSVSPISIQNESKVLQHIKRVALEGLSKYKTSYEDDLKILQKSHTLSQNQKHAVLFRSGEKYILRWWIELVDVCMPLFDLNSRDLKKFKINNKLYEEYMNNCILPLVRRERHWNNLLF